MIAREGVTRGALLRRAAVAGGIAVAAGASGGWLTATAAGAPPEEDVAWLHFGVAAEYVAVEYFVRARRAGVFRGPELRAAERATSIHLAHRRRLTEALVAAGGTPIEDPDLEISFPADAFVARRGALVLGRRIGGTLLHAYLGAASTVSDADLRRLFSQLSASTAQQVAHLAGLAGVAPVTAFPSVHGLDAASDDLARFLP